MNTMRYVATLVLAFSCLAASPSASAECRYRSLKDVQESVISILENAIGISGVLLQTRFKTDLDCGDCISIARMRVLKAAKNSGCEVKRYRFFESLPHKLHYTTQLDPYSDAFMNGFIYRTEPNVGDAAEWIYKNYLEGLN